MLPPWPIDFRFHVSTGTKGRPTLGGGHRRTRRVAVWFPGQSARQEAGFTGAPISAASSPRPSPAPICLLLRRGLGPKRVSRTWRRPQPLVDLRRQATDRDGRIPVSAACCGDNPGPAPNGRITSCARTGSVDRCQKSAVRRLRQPSWCEQDLRCAGGRRRRRSGMAAFAGSA